ncbi:MAG: hypothetical protein VKJ02_18635 [Snowella sp.]|nr:hypothetical protein [Snowella sp.]
MNVTGLFFYAFTIHELKVNRIVILLLLSSCAVCLYPKTAVAQSFPENIENAAAPVSEEALISDAIAPISSENGIRVSPSSTPPTISQEEETIQAIKEAEEVGDLKEIGNVEESEIQTAQNTEEAENKHENEAKPAETIKEVENIEENKLKSVENIKEAESLNNVENIKEVDPIETSKETAKFNNLQQPLAYSNLALNPSPNQELFSTNFNNSDRKTFSPKTPAFETAQVIAQPITEQPILQANVENSPLSRPENQAIAPISPETAIGLNRAPITPTIQPEEDLNDLRQFMVYQEPTPLTTPTKELFSANSSNSNPETFSPKTPAFETTQVIAQAITEQPVLQANVENATLPKSEGNASALIAPETAIGLNRAPITPTIQPEDDFNDLRQFMVYQEPTPRTTPTKELFSGNSGNSNQEPFSTKTPAFETAQVIARPVTAQPVLQANVENATLPKSEGNASALIAPETAIGLNRAPLSPTSQPEDDFNDLRQFMVYQEPTPRTTPTKELFSGNSGNSNQEPFSTKTQVFETAQVIAQPVTEQPVLQANVENAPPSRPEDTAIAPISPESVISQGGSVERKLDPTIPPSNLEQEKDPSEPPDFVQPSFFFQEPTPKTTPETELFSPNPNDLKIVQFSSNSELFDIIQEINLGDYYDTVFGPILKAIEQRRQQFQPTGTIAEQIEQMMENAISGTSVRYPWILNSSDNLSFSPLLFKPKKNEFYLGLDLRQSEGNPVVNKITFGAFHHKDQFYWVLDQNRIVIETVGVQGGLIYQGLEQDVQLQQTLTLTQALSGYQAAWVIPYDLQRLFKPEDLGKYTVISIGGQLINSDSASGGSITIDSSNLITSSQETVYLPKPQTLTNQIGIASTYNQRGGGSLFNNLAVENAPLILQAFPTTNLQPLFGTDLKEGAVVPKEKLAEAGISFGNLFKGEPAKFTAPITSVPGIQIGQGEKFDNKDLLNVLVNPFLTDSERDYHYLNSLLWVTSGVLQPNITTNITGQSYLDWYRLFFSIPHNRIMLQYSPDTLEATYFNLYSNPGISFTLPYDKGHLDETQSLNSSIGMLIGVIFELFNVENLNESIDEAKEQREDEKPFSSLTTQITAEGRKQINKRLNTNLAYATIGSSLNQVSGFITFPSIITPTDSSLFQIKTGNLQRAVQFLGSEVGDWVEGDTTIASARLSNRSFGPLTFLGNTLPILPTPDRTNQNQTNQLSTAEVILISPEGQQFIQKFDSNNLNLTDIPTTIKNYDLAFDRLILQQTSTRPIENNYFNGYLYLPTIELVYAGTDHDFTYSFNTGVWFNVDNWSAPGVRYNNLGIYEPPVGVYTNMLLSSNTTHLDFNENNQLEGITSHSPLLRFNWNSANNSNNPWQVSLSYTFSKQTQKYGLSLTGGLGIIPQYSNGPVIGLIYAKLGLGFGLSVDGNVELGNIVYYGANILQSITPNIALGPYISNYTDLNQGFNSRTLALNYGGIIRYSVTDSPINLTGKFGTGENGFEASIKGEIRF